ncbi:sodium ion-translocating decarboxylase subunit beta [Ornithinimicrobium panacihumi]|uniref:sodium ion-translocating decarboxylase subunit beta n=1 Tax=Ornithinimicrobium panacihumi TaxID=2008449 RepID=UPI003F8AFCAF
MEEHLSTLRDLRERARAGGGPERVEAQHVDNFLLMHAMGANAAGQIASCVAGGVLLALMGAAAV